jgi:glycosyltransferase involved in cell wall biosynthesis
MARPAKILFLSSCVRGGGAGWSLYYLLKHLDRDRVDPIVVVPERGIFDRRFEALGVRVETPAGLPHRVRQQRFASDSVGTRTASLAMNLGGMASLVPRLAALVRREGVELVYANNMMVKPLAALTAQLARVPCVLHARNIHEAPAAVAFYGAVARVPAVRRIITNSSASAVPYRRAAPGKVIVIHNGVDLEEYDLPAHARGTFRAAHGLKGKTIVGFTGNLIPRKGLEPLVRAAARVLPGRDDVVFVALGRTPMGQPEDWGARYEALAAELGIADRFLFPGFVDDVRAAVADFDVLALPSLQEPFGRSIIEAMALGTPVVASDVGGIPEIITNGEDGVLVPPGDAEALAGALASMLDHPERRRAIADAGRRRIETSFDVARLTERVQSVLLGAIGRDRAGLG